MQRRDFINNLSQMTTLVCAGSLLAACSKSSGNPYGNNNNNAGGSALISADLNTELAAIGDSKVMGSAIVIRETAGNDATCFTALSLVCTHLGCTVAFDNTNDVFNCPCHGSKFDGQGGVLNGPAATPLNKLKVAVNGSVLTVS